MSGLRRANNETFLFRKSIPSSSASSTNSFEKGTNEIALNASATTRSEPRLKQFTRQEPLNSSHDVAFEASFACLDKVELKKDHG
jgi:hypothetical protein